MSENEKINTAQSSESSCELVITFELVTEGNVDDPALNHALVNETITALQQQGYGTRPPAYSEQKGAASFLVEFVINIQQIATTVWDNHAAIAEGIGDFSGLIAICTGIVSVVKQVQQSYEKQVGKAECTAHPIKMTIEIDGKPLVIEASDITQADTALQLALKYRAAHPDLAPQVTTKSKAKVQGRVPARKRRPRR
jgi:hypothetical protein